MSALFLVGFSGFVLLQAWGFQAWMSRRDKTPTDFFTGRPMPLEPPPTRASRIAWWSCSWACLLMMLIADWFS